MRPKIFYLACLLILATVLGGCDDAQLYQKQIEQIMNYNKDCVLRLFLRKPVDESGRYVPEYIEIKYIPLQKILETINQNRIEETEKFLKKHQFVRAVKNPFFPLVTESEIKNFEKAKNSLLELRPGESQEQFLNRFLENIPDKFFTKTINSDPIHQEKFSLVVSGNIVSVKYPEDQKMPKKIKVSLRELFVKEVWNKYLIPEECKLLHLDDVILWVTYYGTVFPLKNDLIYRISNVSPEYVFAIKDSGNSPDFFYLGYERGANVYRSHVLLVWKKARGLLSNKNVLTVSGDLLAKDSFDTKILLPEPVGLYKKWLESEVWWKIHREIDVYIDDKGLCHFENERQLFDESQNPSVNFQVKLIEKK